MICGKLRDAGDMKNQRRAAKAADSSKYLDQFLRNMKPKVLINIFSLARSVTTVDRRSCEYIINRN